MWRATLQKLTAKYRSYDHSKGTRIKFVIKAGIGIAASVLLFVGNQAYLLKSIHSVPEDVLNLDRCKDDYIVIHAEYGFNGKRNANYELKAPWFPWMKSWSDDPWTLLRLAESNDHSVRLMGVKALSEKHHWHESTYLQLSQASEARTLIGLARSPDVDPKFFLPPPELPKSKGSIEDEFRVLLSALPTSYVDECTKYFTSTALNQGHEAHADERGGLWCFGGNGLAFTQSLTPVPEEQVELFCLQALASHSQVLSHCASIVRLGGLQLLQRVASTKRNMLRIERLIARIVANIAVDPTQHAQIVSSGWISILVMWLDSSDAGLAGQAARALANLDRDFGPEKYVDGIFLLHPTHRYTEPVYVDVIFVHGLLGGAFKTWRQHDCSVPPPGGVTRNVTGDGDPPGYTFCWPRDWLAADCPHSRILTVEYDTHVSEWSPMCPFDSEQRSIQVCASNLLGKLKVAGVGKRPVVWVGHSMGGLLIKQILQLAEEDTRYHAILNQTKGLVMYSVPHRGSSLAAYWAQAKYILAPSVEVQQLNADSDLLKTLHRNFQKIISDRMISCLSFSETVKTDLGMNLSVLIVPDSSSDIGIGEHVHIDSNHLNTCKPKNKESVIYQRTLDFVNAFIPNNVLEHVLDASQTEDNYILPWSV